MLKGDGGAQQQQHQQQQQQQQQQYPGKGFLGPIDFEFVSHFPFFGKGIEIVVRKKVLISIS